ncbi:MAG: nicotinamide mononucleotide transporter, partial [Candidatus Tectomicrobia bacterium]
AVMSLVGQWMLAKKILENWLIWIVVDPIYVGIFIYQGQYPTALLYTSFLILAILGLLAWRKTMRAESAIEPT